MKHYQQAEEFLGIANWTIMKNTDPPNHIKAELHQNFGLLYVNKGEIDKAIEHLATSVCNSFNSNIAELLLGADSRYRASHNYLRIF